MPPKQNNRPNSEPALTPPANSGESIQLMQEKKYPPDGFQEQILQLLYNQRKDGKFCDIQLKLSATKTVYAHKALLASRSAYFEGMFTSSFVEATSNIVDMSHITDREDILENVIDTFYGRSFMINEGNVSETINLATMLMLNDLKDACSQVLNVVVNIRNATGLLQLAISFDLRDLKEKVVPVVRSRFHDYILFQDDICDFTVEGFEMLHSIIDTTFISRKSRYIEFILNWFLTLETDERAKKLISAMKGVKFKVTRKTFKGFAGMLDDLMNHLDDVNIDLSEEVVIQLKAIFLNVKRDFLVKKMETFNKNIEERNTNDDSDSDLDDEPERPLYFNGTYYRYKFIGPPTEQIGFTPEQEKDWEKAHADMKERDQHRIWAKQWPEDASEFYGKPVDPNRPKNIRRERSPYFFKTRKYRDKCHAEIKEEADLIEALVVLAPSKELMEGSTGSGPTEDTLDICIFIPRKHAWFKIGSLSASSIQKKFNQDRPASSKGTDEYRRRPRPWGSTDNSDSDDEEDAYRFSAMMDMYGRDFQPEMLMMMMRDMPSSRRHRIMEEMMHGRIPPRMLRHLIEHDMFDEDMYRYDHRMREMSRRHPRMAPFGTPRSMRSFLDQIGSRTTNVKSLTDKKWKIACLKYKLYFCHDDIRNSVFCYDLGTQEWSKSEIYFERNESDDKYREKYLAAVDGIELIVMGQTLHAVLRVAMVNGERSQMRLARKEDLIEESKKQEVFVKHVVYRMTEELDKAAWQKVMDSEGHYENIPIDEKHRLDPEKESYKYSPMYGSGFGPLIQQPDALKTILFAADEEKLIILTAVRHRLNYDKNVVGYSMTHIEILYLDLTETDRVHDSPVYNLFLTSTSPLYGDDLVGFVDDSLEAEILFYLGKPDPNQRFFGRGTQTADKNREFQEGQERYPRCSSIMVSNPNGKNLWVLRGKDDDVSETLELYATMCGPTKEYSITQVNHTPPPFKCFTLAACTKLHKDRVKTFSEPTKYLHAD